MARIQENLRNRRRLQPGDRTDLCVAHQVEELVAVQLIHAVLLFHPADQLGITGPDRFAQVAVAQTGDCTDPLVSGRVRSSRSVTSMPFRGMARSPDAHSSARGSWKYRSTQFEVDFVPFNRADFGARFQRLLERSFAVLQHAQPGIDRGIATVPDEPRHHPEDRRSSFYQGQDWCGNVDICDIRVGTTVVLPVHVEGALFSPGCSRPPWRRVSETLPKGLSPW